jgi:hypothetical protein
MPDFLKQVFYSSGANQKTLLGDAKPFNLVLPSLVGLILEKG